MRKRAAIVAALALSACGEPVPQEKAAYVGEWRGENMALAISQDGRVAYKRVKGSASTSVDAPIQRFEGDSFVVGVAFMSTRFEVSRAPWQDAGHWKMVVDGVELTKVR